MDEYLDELKQLNETKKVIKNIKEELNTQKF
jgi:hypothetical protein